MYAIQNIKTGKFLFGTDFNYSPNRQRTSFEQMLTFNEYSFAEAAFLHRQCGRDYRIVELEPVKVKEVFPYVTKKERNGH